MKNGGVRVVIPALNEEGSIGKVIADLPSAEITEIIVVSNGSTDDTEKIARQAGATVLKEAKKGYGSACLKGLEYIASLSEETTIVAFIDGDYSDYPKQLSDLLAPIRGGTHDFVIGSRTKGQASSGALQPVQRFGNWLASFLMHILYGANFSDLGPFRAIRWTSLQALGMEDENFGWTIEMQIKSFKARQRILEVPVDYKARIGKSKISGTMIGSVRAGWKIIYTIFRYL